MLEPFGRLGFVFSLPFPSLPPEFLNTIRSGQNQGANCPLPTPIAPPQGFFLFFLIAALDSLMDENVWSNQDENHHLPCGTYSLPERGSGSFPRPFTNSERTTWRRKKKKKEGGGGGGALLPFYSCATGLEVQHTVCKFITSAFVRKFGLYAPVPVPPQVKVKVKADDQTHSLT